MSVISSFKQKALYYTVWWAMGKEIQIQTPCAQLRLQSAGIATIFFFWLFIWWVLHFSFGMKLVSNKMPSRTICWFHHLDYMKIYRSINENAYMTPSREALKQINCLFNNHKMISLICLGLPSFEASLKFNTLKLANWYFTAVWNFERFRWYAGW